jgi:hypothetical protein
MSIGRRLNKYLRLPGGMALLLGLGAATTGGAAANVPDPTAQNNASAAVLGGVTVRAKGSKIYLSEGGRETGLPLSATPERDRLLRLLDEHGPAGIRLDPDPRLIMSGGGGAGFSLWDIKKSLTDKPPPAPPDPPQPTTPSRSTKGQPPPRDRNQSTDRKD